MKTPLIELAGYILELADRALAGETSNEAICAYARDAAHLLEAEGRRMLHLARHLSDAAQFLTDSIQTEEAA